MGVQTCATSLSLCVCFRNSFLDADGWGLVSAIEQNFNPVASDITRKEHRGYLRMMSSDYVRSSAAKTKQNQVFFPGQAKDQPYTDILTDSRYTVALPCYPFRTLSPRTAALLQTGRVSPSASFTGGGGGGLDFDYASCLLPAHTQVTIVLKRREGGSKGNLLDYMWPYDLPESQGSLQDTLREEDRDAVLTFVGRTRPTVAAAATATTTPSTTTAATSSTTTESVRFKIIQVRMIITNMSLQVSSSSLPSPSPSLTCAHPLSPPP